MKGNKGTDGVTISDFIHQSASGITILEALQVYQYGIRNKQAKKRRCKRDIQAVMKLMILGRFTCHH